MSLFLTDFEEKNYQLYQEIYNITYKLKQFKKNTGNYPGNLQEIQISGNICISQPIKLCRKVFYKPSPDKKDFRLSAYSFTDKILFYHPEISMTPQEYQALTLEEKNFKLAKYGLICTYCEAAKSYSKTLPIYAKSSKVFANPQEWPDL